MDSDRESTIQKHLQGLVLELEKKLANPKNTWKRQENIQAQIADAQKRLSAVQRSNRRYTSRRNQGRL